MTLTSLFIDSPQSEKLWMDPRPMWLWDVTLQRIAWANQACLDFSRAPSVADLTRLKFSPDAAFIKQLTKLSLVNKEPEGVRELIRFPAQNGDYIFDCLCKHMELKQGRAAVLVTLVADKGKLAPKSTRQPNSKKRPKRSQAQSELPIKPKAERPQKTQPDASGVQILSFDTGQRIDGFEVETQNVDEEDLLTLREIARMINGSIGLAAGQSAISSRQVGAADGRPLVATRSAKGDANHDNNPNGQAGPSSAPGPQLYEVQSQPDQTQDLPLRDANQSTPAPARQSGSVAGASLGKSERNYFLESLPAALAIAMGGRLMRANEAFLYAFGFGSERELRKAGGLSALFPESQNGVLLDHLSANNAGPASAKSSRSARISTLAISRSGRKRRISIAFRNVSTGREPVQILILSEDALGHQDHHLATKGTSHGNAPLDPDDKSPGQDSIDFLASVSHEVRTPLNSIIGFSELMKDERFGAVDDDKFRGYAADIHASAMHALSLINDLLDITKIIAGKPDLDFAPVSSSKVIHEAVSAMRVQAQRKRINLTTSVQEGLPALYADQRSLRQIMLNLISNAIKFTATGGEVSVSSRLHKEGGVLLTITDTGIGMHMDQINTALEPFAQLATSRPDNKEAHSLHDSEKGTGLGLPLTKALVKAHHARFKIDSTPGKGTTVEILFPTDRLAR